MSDEIKNWLVKMYFAVSWALLISFIISGVVDAAPMQADDETPGIFNTEYTKLADDSTAHYRVDVGKAEGAAEEDESFMDSVRNFNPVGDVVEENGQAVMNGLVNLGLTWNMMMTNLMIGILNFGFETEIVNSLADAMEGMVQNMAGVAGGKVGGGLYGALIGFAVVATGIAVIFQLLVRRAPLSSMQTVVKSVVAIALAITLFANFGPLIKGMNEISTQISSAMLTGSTNLLSTDNRTAEELREEVSANLWDSFIGRPYLIMQYGTDDVEEIGESRINDLLTIPEGPERQEYVDEIEIAERGNENMTFENAEERAAFTLVYSIVNMVVSVPIFVLALALLVFQIWFLMIAFLSPFFLIQAAFPGQFGVLKRYAVELAYPLVCKVIATIATFFVFSFGFIIYSIPSLPETTGIPKYFVAAAFYLVLFLVLFFLRKRIALIMGAGNVGPFEALRYDLNGLKSSMDSAADKIGNVGKIAAATTVGAITGGPVGAAAGAAGQTAKNHAEQEENNSPSHQKANTAPLVHAEKESSEPVEMATAKDSLPVASVKEEDAVATEAPELKKETKMEKIEETSEEIEPVEQTSEMSKPLVSIYDVSESGNVTVRRKEEVANIKKGEGDNDV